MDPSQIESLVSYAASHSPHHRTRVGAVLLAAHRTLGRTLTMGWNRPHPYSSTWLHAEHVAILRANDEGLSTKGATLLVNWFPCIDCARRILQAGITTVYYHHLSSIARWSDPDYRFHEANVLLRVGGVKLIPY